MFMTDTAKVCDLIIPTSSQLESEDLLFSSMMNPYLIYNEKLIEPREKLMDEYYFFMELAKEMNLNDYPYVEKTDYLEKVIEPLKHINSNINLEFIKSNYLTLHKNIAWEDKKFMTKSRKFEIIRLYDLNNKVKCSENKAKIRLLTNHGRDSLSSQHFIDEEGMSIAYINENMSKSLDIDNDEIVYLKSENGQIKVRIKIDSSISDKVVMMFVGWWEKHGNPNVLTNSGISDIGGQITYNETFVDIIKI